MKISDILAIFMFCHRKPERSFHFKGKQFPVCARCTGIILGWIIGIILAILFGGIRWYFIIPMLLPAIFDGTLQLLTSYTSNNIKRLISGTLLGIGWIYVLVIIHHIIIGMLLNIIK